MASTEVEEVPSPPIQLERWRSGKTTKDHRHQADIIHVLFPVLGGKRVLESRQGVPIWVAFAKCGTEL
jgi:hypothetical protein